MRMKKKVYIYKIKEIPDRSYPRYVHTADGGDVPSAVWSGSDQLLRALSSFPSGAASISIRYVYNPLGDGIDLQSRLSLSIIVRVKDEFIARGILPLLEHGPLRMFYTLNREKRFSGTWDRMNAACDVVRREDAVDPLHGAEFNPRIPEFYYTLSSFEPQDRNDFLDLDRVLGVGTETAVIDICVEPVNISGELKEHTRYLDNLHHINRTWDLDVDEPDEVDFLEDGDRWRSSSQHTIKPLRHKEPLSEDILRNQQPLHQTLRKPHLLFHIRALAESEAVARLLGSMVAESAFAEGSYRLFPYTRGDGTFEEAVKRMKKGRVFAPPVHEHIFKDRNASLYSGLERLGHVAPVEELSGVFRLPVASYGSPCCIRKNTDPKPEDIRNLIVLGYDEDPPQIEAEVT